MMKRFLKCSSQSGTNQKNFQRCSHWHCAFCDQIFNRKNAMQCHLDTHFGSWTHKAPPAPRPVTNAAIVGETATEASNAAAPSNVTKTNAGKMICFQCNKTYPGKHALQWHVHEQHGKKIDALVHPGRFLRGTCVDFKKGIFLVSKTFSGTMHPIHCKHSTHRSDACTGSSACELDECRDTARVARQSGHPAFECVHLQSVQYADHFEPAVVLSDKSLKEAINSLKWLKESRKQSCLAHREKARKCVSPLIVRFPEEACLINKKKNWTGKSIFMLL